MTQWALDTDRWLKDLRHAADEFRIAMIQSGAVLHVGQDTYYPQLKALECALNPMNYAAPADGEQAPTAKED